MKTRTSRGASTVRSLAFVLPVGLAACGSSGGDGGAGGSAGADAQGGVGGTSAGSGGSSAASGSSSAGSGASGVSGAVATGGTSGSGTGGSGGAAAGVGGNVGGGGADGGAGVGAAGVTGGVGGSTGGGGGKSGSGGTSAGRGGGSGSGSGGTSGSGACPASATATPGETTKTIMVGGLSRTFIVHVPPGYTGRAPVPVVIDFHPLGGSGSQQRNATGWASVADAQGIIMVWPNGVGNSWNVGRCCANAQSQAVDDVAFTRAIITTLRNEACVDAKRIYASGCSNGGGMAYRLACDAADVIAAVAPVDFDCITGPTNNPSCASCSPSRPISEIQFRATNDSAVPYNGGNTPVVQGLAFPGALANFTTWGGLNMCTGSPQPLPGHSACQAYPMCGGDVDTALCTVQNGTHCGNYSSFGIVNIAWELFQQSTLP